MRQTRVRVNFSETGANFTETGQRDSRPQPGRRGSECMLLEGERVAARMS